MKAKIIKIGNSKGLRLPQSILKQYEINEAVELIFEESQIILKPIIEPRKNWAEQFQKMAEDNEDELLIDDILEDEELDEWN